MTSQGSVRWTHELAVGLGVHALHDTPTSSSKPNKIRSTLDLGYSWTAPSGVGPSPTPSTRWPSMAASPEVLAVAATVPGPMAGWTQLGPDEFGVELSTDGGRTFRWARLSTPSAWDSDLAAVAIHGRAIWVHFSENGDHYLQFSPDAGESWLSWPSPIDRRVAHEACLATADALLSVEVQDEGDDSIWLHRFEADGTITSSVRLDAATHEGIGHARIARDAELVVVAWLGWHQGGVRTELHVAVSRDEGRTFEDALILNAPLESSQEKVRSFGLDVFGESVLVAYRHERWPRTNIHAITSHDGGRTFGSPLVLNPNARPSSHVREVHCALHGDTAVVAWARWHPAGQDMDPLVAAHSADGGRTFGAPTQVSSGGIREFRMARGELGTVAVTYEPSGASGIRANVLHVGEVAPAGPAQGPGRVELRMRGRGSDTATTSPKLTSSRARRVLDLRR